jgi:hypothetical protein
MTATSFDSLTVRSRATVLQHEQGRDLRRGVLLLHPGDDVHVRVHREAGGGISQTLGDHLDGDAGLEGKVACVCRTSCRRMRGS